MSILEIITTILATLSPDAPPDKDDQPKAGPPADHYFCCGAVSAQGQGSGTECRKTDEGESQLCNRQLCCKAGYVVDGIVTTCTAAKQNAGQPLTQFCCETTGTDGDGRSTGTGCARSSGACDDRELACRGSWTSNDGAVTCL